MGACHLADMAKLSDVEILDLRKMHRADEAAALRYLARVELNDSVETSPTIAAVIMRAAATLAGRYNEGMSQELLIDTADAIDEYTARGDLRHVSGRAEDATGTVEATVGGKDVLCTCAPHYAHCQLHPGSE
jgi:hypothetical protein